MFLYPPVIINRNKRFRLGKCEEDVMLAQVMLKLNEIFSLYRIIIEPPDI
ncbi:hypothetical protein DOY81_005956 [Sarcophaga bullata]|nr:hypothetical protein DOY81_005956 [Sarcophaga bullata]